MFSVFWCICEVRLDTPEETKTTTDRQTRFLAKVKDSLVYFYYFYYYMRSKTLHIHAYFYVKNSFWSLKQLYSTFTHAEELCTTCKTTNVEVSAPPLSDLVQLPNIRHSIHRHPNNMGRVDLYQHANLWLLF